MRIVEKKKPNKTKILCVRLTEDEWSELEVRFTRSGYGSMSRFHRDLLLRNAPSVPGNRNAGEATRKEINHLMGQLSKIGNNFNQTVKLYRRFIRLSEEQNRICVSEAQMMYLLESTDKHFANIQKIAEEIRELYKKEFEKCPKE